jgi:hypothetical protein
VPVLDQEAIQARQVPVLDQEAIQARRCRCWIKQGVAAKAILPARCMVRIKKRSKPVRCWFQDQEAILPARCMVRIKKRPKPVRCWFQGQEAILPARCTLWIKKRRGSRTSKSANACCTTPRLEQARTTPLSCPYTSTFGLRALLRRVVQKLHGSSFVSGTTKTIKSESMRRPRPVRCRLQGQEATQARKVPPSGSRGLPRPRQDCELASEFSRRRLCGYPGFASASRHTKQFNQVSLYCCEPCPEPRHHL